MSEAIRSIECEEGRDARDVEVAQRMGLKLEDYHQVLQDGNQTFPGPSMLVV